MTRQLCLFLFYIAFSHSQDTCEEYCSEVTECANDPHSHSSYCKVDNTRPSTSPVCFGLYWRDFARTQQCFAPNDPTCPQAFPVLCPSTTTTPAPLDTCFINCLVTPACAFSPTHQGSYCKSNLSVPVCFGLYWRDPQQTESCFFPADPTCPQHNPIRCG